MIKKLLKKRSKLLKAEYLNDQIISPIFLQLKILKTIISSKFRLTQSWAISSQCGKINNPIHSEI
jgi:hypothetical protein